MDGLSIKERVEKMWKLLNKYGIYTEEQLDKAIKENPLDIGIFTIPYRKEEAV